MSVIIENIEYQNEFWSGVTSNLLGNVDNKIVCTVDWRSQKFVDAHAANRIRFGAEGYLTDDYLQGVDGNAVFAEFNVGDEITIVNADNPLNDGVYTIIEKPDSNTIRLNTDVGFIHIDGGADIICTNLATAVSVYSNLVENQAAENYESLTTGEVQRWQYLSADETDLSTYAMTAQGSKSYQMVEETITITGRGQLLKTGVPYARLFRTVITFYIKPFGNPEDQAGYVEDGTRPSYLEDDLSLKHICLIEVSPDITKKNLIQSGGFTDREGNVGGANENFNGGSTNYSIQNLQFQRDVAVGALDEVMLVPGTTEKTVVTLSIVNTVDAPFIDFQADPVNATKLITSFTHLPTDTEDYVDNSINAIKQTLGQNFHYDRASDFADSVPGLTNGEQYATDRQAIEDYDVTYVSATQLDVSFKINLPQSFYDKFVNGDNEVIRSDRYYRLAFQVADSFKTYEISDSATVEHRGQLFLDREIQDVITFDTLFIEHPYSNRDDGVASPIAYKGSEMVSSIIISLDRDLAADSLINSITCKLQAKKTGDTFTLESYTKAFSKSNLQNGVQFIDDTQLRGFPVLNDEIRKRIVVKRRSDLDVGNQHKYEIQYPWMMRFEYWEALAGVSGDFLDINEPNNGQNHDWTHYDNGTWVFQYVTEVSVDHSGITQVYSDETTLQTRDLESNPDWDNYLIESLDPDTLLPIEPGGVKSITGFNSVVISAQIEKVAGLVPLIGDVWFLFKILAFEKGGINDHDNASTEVDRSPVSAFEGLIQADSPSAGVFRGRVTLDTSQLDLSETKFLVMAQIAVKG